MKNKLYFREVYLGEYHVEWADQKISLDCSCGYKDIEIFSDTYTICPECKRRYSILEIIKVENQMRESDETDIGDTLDLLADEAW